MVTRSKSILKPPVPEVPGSPRSKVISQYLEALEADCQRILLEEGITGNEDDITQSILELAAKGAFQ